VCLVNNSVWSEIEGSRTNILPQYEPSHWEIKQHQESNAPRQNQQHRVKHPLQRLVLDETLFHLPKRRRIEHRLRVALILLQQTLLQPLYFHHLLRRSHNNPHQPTRSARAIYCFTLMGLTEFRPKNLAQNYKTS